MFTSISFHDKIKVTSNNFKRLDDRQKAGNDYEQTYHYNRKTVWQQRTQNCKEVIRKLGIHYYDKELIKLASEQNDISYDELVKVDEKRANPWRYPVEDPAQMESVFGLNR